MKGQWPIVITVAWLDLVYVTTWHNPTRTVLSHGGMDGASRTVLCRRRPSTAGEAISTEQGRRTTNRISRAKKSVKPGGRQQQRTLHVSLFLLSFFPSLSFFLSFSSSSSSSSSSSRDWYVLKSIRYFKVNFIRRNILTEIFSLWYRKVVVL